MTQNSDSSGVTDNWANGQSYEAYVGRWSRAAALEFLGWLAVPADRRWLDIGCGTGALTGTILRTASPKSVTGIDASEGYVAYVRQAISDPRATFQSGSVDPLPFADGAF